MPPAVEAVEIDKGAPMTKSTLLLQDLEDKLFGAFDDDSPDKPIDVHAIEKKLSEARQIMQAQEQPPPLEPHTFDDAELQALKDAIDTGGVDISSGIGQIFSREHRPGSANHKTYNQSRAFAAKASYRLEWAKQRYKTKSQEARQSKEWGKIEETNGTYLPIGRIFKEEGGDKSALRATRLYVSKCVAMSGQWVKFNVMTERDEYFYLRHSCKETFGQKWQMFQHYSDEIAQAQNKLCMQLYLFCFY